MRYLITGGAGFIGSHLAERLIAEGHEVDIIDNLSTGSPDNVANLTSIPRFHFTVDTIFNAPVVDELVERADVVVHLAAAVGVFQIIESPVRTIETNIRGTEIVLNCAAKRKKLTVLASTSEVYGKASKVPFAEDDDCVLGPSSRTRWAYAASKLVDEFLALSYFREKKLPTIIIRFFNTVGPRQTGRYGMVLPRFVQQALQGGPLTVFGDGKQSRSFGYVGDAVSALLRLIREPRAFGQVVNVGSDRETTIEELAHMVRDRAHPGAEIQYLPYDHAYEKGFEDMRRRVPDLTRLRDLTSHRPTLSIEEIVDRVIAEQRSRPDAP